MLVERVPHEYGIVAMTPRLVISSRRSDKCIHHEPKHSTSNKLHELFIQKVKTTFLQTQRRTLLIVYFKKKILNQLKAKF